MTDTLDVMFGKLRDAAAAHDDDLRNPAAARAPTRLSIHQPW
jgi:hypothetical protein